MASRTYLDEGLLSRLAAGHTFDFARAIQIIEAALHNLNRHTGLPDRMARWLRAHPGQPLPQRMFVGKPRIVIELTRSRASDQELNMAAVLQLKQEIGIAPALLLSLHSPVLDIPMRVEVPLRAIFRHGAHLDGYTVYLHTLMTDDGQAYLYYGLTRRPWNLRFLEHVRAGSRKGVASRRLFVRTLASLIASLIAARVAQRVGEPGGPALAGMVTTLCLVGGTRAQALQTEEYLVDKYSLASKRHSGLNMIPGGEAGIRVAQHFRNRRRDTDETTVRELARRR